MSCNSVSGSNISSIVLLKRYGGSDMHDEEDQLVDQMMRDEIYGRFRTPNSFVRSLTLDFSYCELFVIYMYSMPTFQMNTWPVVTLLHIFDPTST